MAAKLYNCNSCDPTADLGRLASDGNEVHWTGIAAILHDTLDGGGDMATLLNVGRLDRACRRLDFYAACTAFASPSTV